jgi:hypothetical protein
MVHRLGGDYLLMETGTLPIHALGTYLSRREVKR